MSNYDDIINNASTKVQSSQLSKEDYAAKKKAERDNIFELSDLTAMEVAGDGCKFQQYLDVQSRLSRYSAVNALLILAQKPESTRLGDFESWKEKGGFVKPGQTGIAILEPHEYIKEDGTPGTGYNIKKVFDISQVDARRVKSSPPPNYSDRQILLALIHKAPMKVSTVAELPGDLAAMTNHETGEINVRKGLSFNDLFRSIAHELACAEIDHDNATDPQFTAYCATYILCKKYGVDTQSYNFDNAAHMFEDMEPQEVKGELAKIRDTADIIDGRMARQLSEIDASQKTAKNQEAR